MSKQISTAIILEDEQPSAENLEILIDRHVPSVEIAARFADVDTAWDYLAKNSVDLVFLDVELGTTTGIDFLMKFDSIPFKVIFTTAYEEYALQAIKFSAVDYLLKPIDIEELKTAVAKVQQSLDGAPEIKMLLSAFQKNKLEKLPVPTTEGYSLVPIQKIVRIQSDGSYSKIFLENAEMIYASKNLKEFESGLADHNFVRVHHSHLVNIEKIKKYYKGEGGYLVMDNGDSIDVSKRRKENLLSRLRFS